VNDILLIEHHELLLPEVLFTIVGSELLLSEAATNAMATSK